MILYLVLGMNSAVTTISLSLIDTALFLKLPVPALCLWFLLQARLMAIITCADKPICSLDDGLGVVNMSYEREPVSA